MKGGKVKNQFMGLTDKEGYGNDRKYYFHGKILRRTERIVVSERL